MTALIAGGLGLLAIVLLALLLGRTANGSWTFNGAGLSGEIFSLRAPKVFAALASGAMLAVAGTILQRLTGNEMASPEVLGISAGATFGVAIALFVVSPALPGQFASAALGALVVLSLIFMTARRSSLAPERVLLAGISLSAMVDAVVASSVHPGIREQHC